MKRFFLLLCLLSIPSPALAKPSVTEQAANIKALPDSPQELAAAPVEVTQAPARAPAKAQATSTLADRLQLRVALRIARQTASASDQANIDTVLASPQAVDLVTSSVRDEVDAQGAFNAAPGTIQTFIAWLEANLPAILQLIATIIAALGTT